MRAALPLAALILGGCATAPPAAPAGPDRAAIAQATASAARQVKRCFRTPPRNRAAREVITVIAVRYAPDGTLAVPPRLVSQSGVTPGNQIAAAALAGAAIEAIERCVPINLPVAAYQGGWDEFELTFSPGGLA